MKLHEKIKFLREYRKMSQEDACVAYGMTRPSLSQKELGNTDLWSSEILTISQYHGVSIQSLMSELNYVEIIIPPINP